MQMYPGKTNRGFHQEANIPLAAYARYSSELQRPASIEDQLRNCREGVPFINGFILESCIRSDSAKTGRHVEGREGFNDLIELALSGNAPFRGIVIDDTSRFGRNLTDTLAVLDKLVHANIFVYFVSQRLDSREPYFRGAYVSNASQDEQQSIQMAKKVHRGLVGRALAGFVATGRAYGYRSVAVEDPECKQNGGRGGVLGFALETIPAQAAVVSRIFEMCRDGVGVTTIARILNEEHVPTPRADRGSKFRWSARNIILILRNRKYIGVNEWNKTTTVWDPNLKRKEIRNRPKEEWIVVNVPMWRIIDDQLWAAAHAALDLRRPRARQGGLSRTEKARGYILSGLLVCGECGGNLTIIENRKGGERYLCYRAVQRNRPCCTKTIHRKVLESRLLDVIRQAIESDLPDRLAQAILDFQMQEQLDREGMASPIDLRVEADMLDGQIKSITGVILRTGTSAVIEDQLRRLNVESAQCQAKIERASVSPPAILSLTEAEKVAHQRIQELQSHLAAPAEEQKRRLALAMSPIRLTHYLDGEDRYVRCESAFEFEVGDGRGRVAVPFIGEIPVEKAKGHLFPQSLLDQICANFAGAVRAEEMAKSLGVSRSTVGRWCKRLGLPHQNSGKFILVVPSDVRTWLSARNPPPSRLRWPTVETAMFLDKAA